ncbi:carbohydrate esterase family 4 protein [Mycena rebaudengoi]|nr:carbohydrate esterase family 4 protein [Mycena rebaudengoi]
MRKYPTASFVHLAVVGLLVALVRAADEASEAATTDPALECTPYSYAPVYASRSSFPAIWKPIITIPRADSVALDKFASMKASIPAISPKGKLAFPGDFSNTTYDASDPDCWWTAWKCVAPKLAGLKPDMSTVPEPRTLGYGFDDGPNCSHNAFYDYLAKKEQKATMFFIGSNVMDWPLQAQRAVTDGHEICVHTWSHNYMTAFTNEGAFSELYYTMQAIKLVTGFTPTCWRPPFGDVDDRIRYIAAQLGLETILWKYDSNDWRAGTAPNITAVTVYANYDVLIASVSAGAFDTEGAIMLTHELNNFTMQAAMDYYDRLADAFDCIVPIAVAQNKTQPYTESNYKMPSFAEYTTNKDSGSDSGSRPGSNSHSKSSRGGTANVDQSSAPGVRPSGVAAGLVIVLYAVLVL